MSESCAECGASFADAAELIEHTKQVHATPDAVTAPVDEPQSPRVFVCSFCGATFDSPEEFSSHNQSSHPADATGTVTG